MNTETKHTPGCPTCGGKGFTDSGGVTPWGSDIKLPCPHCGSKIIAALESLRDFATSDRGGDLPITDPLIKLADSAIKEAAPDMAKELAQLKADKAELVALLKDSEQMLESVHHTYIHKPGEALLSASQLTAICHTIQTARALISKHSKVTFGENGDRP